MPLLRDRRFLIAALVILIAVPAYMLAGNPVDDGAMLVTGVQRGVFAVTVTTSGELRAREAVNITGPTDAQQVQVYQMRIASIIPEGTVVDSGDVVAELDRSQVAAKFAEVTLALQKAEAVFEQAMLDSTLTLSQARDQIHNLDLALEERRLAKEQAQYEPPTVQRQAEIELEKAQRALDQARLDYVTKVEQARAKMREVGADLERQRNQLAIVQGVMERFTVRAPSAGMVIYEKEWNGRKRTAGSQVSSWDPTVATLPDLSEMESVTYVNEVDIRKIAVGQPVTITLDSDPSKRLTGTVRTVANMGEQRPNADAKVFEVIVDVTEQDTTLRPGMTTGNAIETARYEDVRFVPIEALGSEEGVPFVYRQAGGGVRKQEVVTGAMNDNHVIIDRGLDEGDRVLLAPPPDGADLDLERLRATSGEPADSASGTAADSAPIAGGDTTLRPTPKDSTTAFRD
jgi:RND family efflux transporter MFP subunit